MLRHEAYVSVTLQVALWQKYWPRGHCLVSPPSCALMQTHQQLTNGKGVCSPVTGVVTPLSTLYALYNRKVYVTLSRWLICSLIFYSYPVTHLSHVLTYTIPVIIVHSFCSALCGFDSIISLWHCDEIPCSSPYTVRSRMFILFCCLLLLSCLLSWQQKLSWLQCHVDFNSIEKILTTTLADLLN